MSALDDVPEPGQAEDADSNLFDAIVKTRHDNPAHRKADDYAAWLGYADNVSYTEFYGAVQALKPCTSLSGKHLSEMEKVLYNALPKMQVLPSLCGYKACSRQRIRIIQKHTPTNRQKR